MYNTGKTPGLRGHNAKRYSNAFQTQAHDYDSVCILIAYIKIFIRANFSAFRVKGTAAILDSILKIMVSKT